MKFWHKVKCWFGWHTPLVYKPWVTYEFEDPDAVIRVLHTPCIHCPVVTVEREVI